MKLELSNIERGLLYDALTKLSINEKVNNTEINRLLIKLQVE